jgi:hypothetical protein
MSSPANALIAWFVTSRCYLWSWSMLAVAIALALGTAAVIAVLTHLPEFIRRLLHHHIDCARCHHRGRPIHLCRTCGAEHCDLRPSVYGMFFVRCSRCHSRLGTLPCTGRRRLRKHCGSCRAEIPQPIGSLPVSHLAILNAQIHLGAGTTFSADADRAVFRHEIGIGDLPGTCAAPAHRYLTYLDAIVIRVDEEGLSTLERRWAAIFGLIERATRGDAARGCDVPVTVQWAGQEALKQLSIRDRRFDFLRRSFRMVTLSQAPTADSTGA